MAPSIQREVCYTGGCYHLQGDGVTVAYSWVWVPTAPAGPPAPPAHLVDGPFVVVDGFHHVREYRIKELAGALWVSVGEELRRLRRQAGAALPAVKAED